MNSYNIHENSTNKRSSRESRYKKHQQRKQRNKKQSHQKRYQRSQKIEKWYYINNKNIERHRKVSFLTLEQVLWQQRKLRSTFCQYLMTEK